MATRAPDKKYHETPSPIEPLVIIQNNFTEMYLILPSIRKGINGSALPSKMITRVVDKYISKRHRSPPEQLVQIQNNFTQNVSNNAL